MKCRQTSLLFLIISIVLSCIACSTTLKSTDITIDKFMPSKLNQEISLSSNSNHYNLKVITEYIKDNKVQLRKLSSSTTVVEQWEYKNDGIYIIFAQEEFYESSNALDLPPTKNELILKEPLKVGNTWTSESGYTYEITSTNYKLETYAGDFDTIEVTSTDGSIVRKNYFAPGLGIIKTTIEFDDGSLTDSELFSVQLSPYNPKDYRFYYYDTANNEIVYTVEGVINYEPERMSNYIIKRLKNPPFDINPTLDPSIKLNNIVPIYKKDFVCVDFSKDFLMLSDMESSTETALLQCIVNTIGYNFDVSNVLITIDGNPYSSGNISMKKAEPFKVDLTQGKEILR